MRLAGWERGLAGKRLYVSKLVKTESKGWAEYENTLELNFYR